MVLIDFSLPDFPGWWNVRRRCIFFGHGFPSSAFAFSLLDAAQLDGPLSKNPGEQVSQEHSSVSEVGEYSNDDPLPPPPLSTARRQLEFRNIFSELERFNYSFCTFVHETHTVCIKYSSEISIILLIHYISPGPDCLVGPEPGNLERNPLPGTESLETVCLIWLLLMFSLPKHTLAHTPT